MQMRKIKIPETHLVEKTNFKIVENFISFEKNRFMILVRENMFAIALEFLNAVRIRKGINRSNN